MRDRTARSHPSARLGEVLCHDLVMEDLGEKNT